MARGASRIMTHEAVAAAILAASMIFPAIAARAQEKAIPVVCSNPVSGVHWQIMIDYQKNTVDSLPAAISPDEISWFDPKDGGYYSIDRESGDLTTALGSSTGGWLRHNHCAVEKSR